MGYLDNTGLSHFTEWVKSKLSVKQNQLTPDDTIEIGNDTIGVKTPVKTIITQEEFDALPESEKNTGLYIVTSESDADVVTKIAINGIEAEISSGVSLEQVQKAITDAIENIQTGITEEEADSKYMGRFGGELTGDEAENGFSFDIVSDPDSEQTNESILDVRKSSIIYEVIGESGTGSVNIGEGNIKLSSINYDGIENTSINIDGLIGAVSICSSGNTLNIDENGASINSGKIMTENDIDEPIQNALSNALDGIQTGITEEQADERYLQLTGGELTGDLFLADGRSITLKEYVGPSSIAVLCEFKIQPKYGEFYLSGGIDDTASISSKGYIDFESSAQFKGDVSLAGNKLLAVKTPVNDSDGANKYYVDNAISAAIAAAVTEAIEEAY